MKTTRVLVADDQALVRAGFCRILDGEPDIEVVGEAADGVEAVEAGVRLGPDVVLMDIRMPNMDGIAATRELTGRAISNPPRVLVLTTFDYDEYVYEALRAGASGFLLKDTPPRALVDGVRTVADGSSLLAPTITTRLVEEFVRRHAPAPHLESAGLTARELEVAVAVAHGWSNREVAENLGVSEPTVKSHLNRVFTKTDVRDRAQLVVWAYENGLVTPGGS